MSRIECCYGCVAPKRHIGCHASCPEYRAEKAATKPRPVDEVYVYMHRKRLRIQRYLHDKGRD